MGLFDVFKKKKAGEIPPPPVFLEKKDTMPPLDIPEFHPKPQKPVIKEPVPTPIQGPPPASVQRPSHTPMHQEPIHKPASPPMIPKFPAPKMSIPPPLVQKPEVTHPLRPKSPEPHELPVHQEIHEKEIESKKREFEKKYSQKPIFVKSDEYRTLLGNINIIKYKVKEVEQLSRKLNENKIERDKETQKWRAMVEDINRKLHKVDKVMET